MPDNRRSQVATEDIQLNTGSRAGPASAGLGAPGPHYRHGGLAKYAKLVSSSRRGASPT